jgi:transketolase
MKKLTVLLLALTMSFFGCKEATDNTKENQEKEVATQQKMNEENENYKEDMEAFKKRITADIDANEKSILAFKIRIASQKMEAKADYEKKIDALNKKNTDMKKRLDDFKTDNKTNWDSFKTEFSRDMDELGAAFKDFTVNNEK